MVTRKELQQICKKRKIPGWYKMNKAELEKTVKRSKTVSKPRLKGKLPDISSIPNKPKNSDFQKRVKKQRKELEEFKKEWENSLNADVYRFTKYSKTQQDAIFKRKVKKDWKETSSKDGYIRWKSNNQIPPSEVLSSFAKIGLITAIEGLRSCKHSRREDAKFIKQLRKQVPDTWKADPEILWEIRTNMPKNEKYFIDPIREAELNLKTGIWKKIK